MVQRIDVNEEAKQCGTEGAEVGESPWPGCMALPMHAIICHRQQAVRHRILSYIDSTSTKHRYKGPFSCLREYWGPCSGPCFAQSSTIFRNSRRRRRRRRLQVSASYLITCSRVLNDPAVHHVSVSASCVSSRPGLTKHAKPNPLPMKSYHYCCHCGKVMFIIVGQIVYSNQLSTTSSTLQFQSRNLLLLLA